VNDISSGIFNMFLGIGQVSGPVFGSIITDMYGFRICCDLVAIISLLYALIYFVMAEGANSYITSKFINVQEEDQLEILNRSVLPMADIKTPIANPSIIRSHSKIMRESGSFIHRMNSSRFI
jgi:MFS family permease